MRLLMSALVGGLLCGACAAAQAEAAGAKFSPSMQVSPMPVVFAGETVTVRITAPSWPGPVQARVWFRSSSHRWSEGAVWQGSCSCFVAHRVLKTSYHGEEQATINVRLTWDTQQLWMTNRALMVDGTRIIPVPTAAPATGGGGMSVYVVQPGDTLTSIAAAHGMTLTALEAANAQIKDPNRIYVGEIVYL